MQSRPGDGKLQVICDYQDAYDVLPEFADSLDHWSAEQRRLMVVKLRALADLAENYVEGQPICVHCGGTGNDPLMPDGECSDCGGTGKPEGV